MDNSLRAAIGTVQLAWLLIIIPFLVCRPKQANKASDECTVNVFAGGCSAAVYGCFMSCCLAYVGTATAVWSVALHSPHLLAGSMVRPC